MSCIYPADGRQVFLDFYYPLVQFPSGKSIFGCDSSGCRLFFLARPNQGLLSLQANDTVPFRSINYEMQIS